MVALVCSSLPLGVYRLLAGFRGDGLGYLTVLRVGVKLTATSGVVGTHNPTRDDPGVSRVVLMLCV